MAGNQKTDFRQNMDDRRQNDFDSMNEALLELSEALTGRSDSGEELTAALKQVSHYYKGAKGVSKKEWIRRAQMLSSSAPRGDQAATLAWVDQRLDQAIAGTGAQYRLAELSGEWYKDASGVLLVADESGVPVALIPGAKGYSFIDPANKKRCAVTPANASSFGNRAFCFYRPLPSRPLQLRDILIYLVRGIELKDVLLILGCLLLSVGLGMLLPLANAMLFGPVLAAQDSAILINAAVMLISVGIAQAVINGAKALALNGVGTKLTLHIQAAAMMRMLSLPASFYRNHSSGELTELIGGFSLIARNIQQVVLGAMLSAVFSLAYLGQIFVISPGLGLPAAAIIVLNVAVTVVIALVQAKVNRKKIASRARLSGVQSTLLDSMREIRINGAESRAFATWAPRYSDVTRLEYNGPLLARIAPTLQLAASLLGTLFIYGAAFASGVSASEYMAFSSAFGMVLGAFMTLASTAGIAAQIKPQMDILKPILDETPEVNEEKTAPVKPSGRIDLENISFGYDPEKPVLQGLKLHIEAGDYIALVGESGCGKSTLMRLMLGFERPSEGRVCYDGLDLSDMDVQTLRRSIGVVLQETQLFQGDIFSNITISAPWLTEEDAWNAARGAGIADDIQRLPMGMSTVVAAGGVGFSGGQKQRLAIARALAPRPAILMFDEATSALDNKTQQIVSDTLDHLECTRIVIAHRISTIRNCRRICMLQNGCITEEGSYEELMARKGAFYELVRRQEL